MVWAVENFGSSHDVSVVRADKVIATYVSMFSHYFHILAVLITILIDINQYTPMASHSALVNCPKGKLRSALAASRCRRQCFSHSRPNF